jgi:hypothetical protein
MKALALLVGINLFFAGMAGAALVETLPPTNIVSDSAVFSGLLAPGKHTTRVAFQYRHPGQRRWLARTPWQRFPKSTTNQLFQAAVTNLPFNTHYEVRATGIRGGVRRYGNIITFRTASGAPDVQTLKATNTTSSATLLTASVRGNAGTTTAWYEWGTTTNYGSFTEPLIIPSGLEFFPAMAGLSALTDNTIYHYRVVASNTAGITFGQDAQFVATDFLQLHAGDAWTMTFADPLPYDFTYTDFIPGGFREMTLDFMPGTFTPNSRLQFDWFILSTPMYSTEILAPADQHHAKIIYSSALGPMSLAAGRFELRMVTGSMVATNLFIHFNAPRFVGNSMFAHDEYSTNFTLRAVQ